MTKRKKGQLTLNVHGYERQIKDIYQQCLDNDHRVYLTFSEVIPKIKSLITYSQCQEQLKINANKTILLFEKEHKTKKNHDKTNLIELDTLLPKIWHIIEKYEPSAQSVFIEQLADISQKGACAQGRNIRLVQFYITSCN